jgi:hypothetical protein
MSVWLSVTCTTLLKQHAKQADCPFLWDTPARAGARRLRADRRTSAAPPAPPAQGPAPFAPET